MFVPSHLPTTVIVTPPMIGKLSVPVARHPVEMSSLL
jgi:hypothetical protein